MRNTLLLAPLALIAAAPAPDPARLPAGVVPIHYELAIDPDADTLSFTGSETITIAVARPTRTIVLNAADLAVGNATVDGTKAASVATDEASQRLTIGLAAPLAPGSHRLSLTFSGKINQSAAGLFATDYQVDGKPKRLLVTQMEPVDGRRFAPMWDEPAIKATFRLTVSTPKGQTSVSNMPVERTAPGADGETLTTFATTPKMSSYLLFLGQGELERRARMVDGVEIGMLTRKGAIDQADYALDAAARLLPFFNDYFGVKYPLPKLDMIAAPGSSQFFSAMENWGAILYFDRALLVDPETTTESQRQEIFKTVAHEMAHQWFGDLVTMSWWDDLWLNEGFASWMEGKASGALNPDWQLPVQIVTGDRESAFGLDARESTHPIIQPIATPDQISQAFDAITYQKGQAVIRMLEGVVGEDAFRAGIRRYMAQHAYRNTVTDDLWSAVSAAAGRPVKPLMDSFTRQGGVPLIRAGEPACVGGATRLTLAQDRFALDPASRRPQRWIVPVAMQAGPARATFDASGAGRRAASVPGCGPLVLNAGQAGYYRTLHAPRHWAALVDGFAALPTVDQAGLLVDSLALGTAGYAPLDRYLALIARVPAGADPLIWSAIARQFVRLDAMLEDNPAQPAFRRRAIALLEPQYRRVGLKPVRGEAAGASQLRERIIVALGNFGDPTLVDPIRKLVGRGLDELPGTIREPATTAYAINATPADWERLRDLARRETNPTAQLSLYGTLGVARDPALADRSLALALGDPTLRAAARSELISAVAEMHPARAFDWAVANDKAVNALVESSARPRFIVGLAGGGSDPALATRVEAYAARALPADSRAGARTAASAIRSRAWANAAMAGPLAVWARR